MRRIAVFLLVTLALGACSGDGADEDTAEPTTAAAPATTPSTSASAAAPTATTLKVTAPCAQAGGTEFFVTTQDFAFAPQCVQLQKGQRLRVKNTGQAKHNVTLGAIDHDLNPGETFTTDPIQDAAGGEIRCKYHASKGMRAELRVV